MIDRIRSWFRRDPGTPFLQMLDEQREAEAETVDEPKRATLFEYEARICQNALACLIAVARGTKPEELQVFTAEETVRASAALQFYLSKVFDADDPEFRDFQAWYTAVIDQVDAERNDPNRGSLDS